MNTTMTTVTLPDTGETLTMSQPPMYRMSDNAWLTAEQADFVMTGVLSLMAMGKVVPCSGTGPNEGELGFVVVEENGEPGNNAVLVVHPDGSGHTCLPLPADFEAWKEANADVLAKAEAEHLTPEEVMPLLKAPTTHGPTEDPFAACL